MSKVVTLTPKNWSEFQHYKDRKPAWIKLHRELLDNYDFMSLPVESRALAPMLWLLASEGESGCFDGSIRNIAFRLRCKEAEIVKALKPLLDAGFFLEVLEEPEVEKWPSRYISDTLRAEIMERDGHKCVQCATTDDLEIDHMIPVSKGGESIATNLQVLCRPCNRRKRTRVASATQIVDQRSLEREREVEKETETDIRAEFEKWKSSYPKRDGSQAWKPAFSYFQSAVRKGHDPTSLIAAAKKYHDECNRKSITGTEKVAQALTWLRQERYTEYLPTPEDEAKLVVSDEFMRAKGFIWDGEKWARANGEAQTQA